MNKFAHVVIGLMSIESAVVAIAYLISGNIKFAIYWAGIAIVNSAAWTF